MAPAAKSIISGPSLHILCSTLFFSVPHPLGKLCVEVAPTSKIAWISEELCIGCGICVKKCPFDAIMIINLPKDLEKETTHRYGPNSFKLHRCS